MIDCSHPPHHSGRNHNNLHQVIEIMKTIQPKMTRITHLSHEMDEWLMTHPLPEQIDVAHDNQSIML